jgi:hypothetical protein
MLARIYEGSTETAANIVIDSVLNVGFTEIGQEAAALDSAARVKLDATQPDYAPATATALSSLAGKFTGITLLARWLGALAGKTADTTTRTEINATTAGAGYNETTDSQEAIRDRGDAAWLTGSGSGSGTGARTVTITVNDGTTVLQNAVVRMTEGLNTYTATTDVSGIAAFNLDDATYTVGISKVGYSYAGTTIVVNGTETATYSMTAVNVTPGSGDLTTGYLTCLDELGAAEANVSVRCQVVQVPTSGTGYAYDSTVQIETSAANGLVEFPMIKGARYLVWRGSIKPPEGIAPILISASAGSTTALGSLIGP